ncbi:hypothetical protein NAT51_07260 [Flavobacterium amniphilum]|uniref:hypothetical protein n=1 Tax=Flavobacterium amniphilum TaxID=1834035 RepID=UPI00202ABE57|nr:hypothetical protein [Flavobacterium amniphilum]MCL9805313.1 hypothetical protein [Flavobacterium amniphilum]
MRLLNYVFIVICFACNQKSNSSISSANENNSNVNTLKENIASQETIIKEIKLPFSSKQLNYSKRDKNGYYMYDKSFIKNKNWYSRAIGKYKSNGNVEIVIVEMKPNGDEHIDPIVKLYSYFKDQITDSLTVYENIQWEGSLKKEFVITQDKIIKVSEKSKGVDFDENGKEIEISSSSSDVYNITSTGRFVTNKWKGRYYFETTNRDDLKTSFDITIENLKNVTVKYVGDGSPPQIYKNLSAEELSSDKIKIVFNEKYDEMGEVYLDKDGDNYSISGKPIYFINPGNDNYPIEKLK